MEILRESRKLAFQWVFMCRLIFLEEAEEGEGEEERGGETATLTPFPPREAQRCIRGGVRRRAELRSFPLPRDVPVRGELASQGKTNCWF